MAVNNTYKRWSLEEELRLEELILTSTHSHRQIGIIMNRPTSSIVCHAKRLNIKSNYIERKYSLDEDFWLNFDNRNYYLAGFIAADGSIIKNSLRIEIHKRDIEVLNFLKNESKTQAVIHPTKFDLIGININYKKWTKDLKEGYNIIPNKTYRLEPPLCTKEQMDCWLVGYTDGDGTIGVNYAPGKGEGVLYISWTSSSYKCLEAVQKHIETHITGNPRRQRKIAKCSHANAYRYGVGGKDAIILFKYLKEVRCFHLSRKWKNNQKVIDFVNKDSHYLIPVY